MQGAFSKLHAQLLGDKAGTDVAHCIARVQILTLVDQAFMAGAQRHTVKLVMKRLKATQGRVREEAKPAAAKGKVCNA